MARPPAPHQMKVLRGEKNKERLNDDFIDIQKMKEIPDCPDWMSEEGIKLFNAFAKDLIGVGLFTHLDISALYDLSELQAHNNRCYRYGEPPKSVYITLVRAMKSDFGLNVLSRERIKTPNKPKANNKWSKKK